MYDAQEPVSCPVISQLPSADTLARCHQSSAQATDSVAMIISQHGTWQLRVRTHGVVERQFHSSGGLGASRGRPTLFDPPSQLRAPAR